MRIAVEGCAHGELEIIYNALEEVEKNDGKKIDLLICCGDFQATRNLDDLNSMAVPDKFKDMCTFYKYYSGEKTAPYLTIFIGGNHEASHHLQELSYGGWVAPKIFYMGNAGVVTVGGLRIAGASGIYKSHDYLQGHFELPPYDHSTMRSVYHTRILEIFRLKQLSGDIDIFLSHDWPNGVTKFGDVEKLLKRKSFFKEDIANDSLGSSPCMELLKHHHPKYWFSAHLHCKFAALIPNEDNTKITKFLALDKCLPKRPFLQILEIEHDETASMDLSYDLEWLTILYLTNHLLSVKKQTQFMPGPGSPERFDFTPTEEEKANVLKKFEDCLKVPENFRRTAAAYNPEMPQSVSKRVTFRANKQTTEFCDKLGIDDPPTVLLLMRGQVPLYGKEESAVELDDESTNDSSNDLLSQSYQSLTGCQDIPETCEDSPLNNSLKSSGLHDLPGEWQEVDTQECGTVDSQESEAVDKEECTAVDEQECKAVDKQGCTVLDSQESKAVDEQEGKRVDEPECTAVDTQECQAVDTKELTENDDVKNPPAVQPTPKQFKRRNLAIYADTSEADL